LKLDVRCREAFTNGFIESFIESYIASSRKEFSKYFEKMTVKAFPRISASDLSNLNQLSYEFKQGLFDLFLDKVCLEMNDASVPGAVHQNRSDAVG
jgi:hypothetical protein